MNNWKLYLNGQQQLFQDFVYYANHKELDKLIYCNKTFYSAKFFNRSANKGKQIQLYLDNQLVFIGWEVEKL